MRILVDYRPALRARTGTGEYIHELVRAYTAAHEDELAIFTSSWKDRPAERTAEELRARVIDRRVPVGVLNYTWHRLEWPPVELLAGASDIVHAAHPLLIPSRRAAQVVTIHDLYFLSHPDRTRAEIRRDYPRLAARHARRADAIITSSQHTKTLVVERFDVEPEKIAVCPPGAPVWRDPPPSPRERGDGYILFIGTLEPRKNIGMLLEAYARLLQRAQRVPRLVLAGGITPDAHQWLERLARPPLAGHAEHVGYVHEERKEPLYRGARVLVLPSFDEGFGLPVLEAMSAGVPVVASNRGSLPEVVGTSGTLLDPENVDGWATALERAIGDDAWAEHQSAAGLERAKAFTWERSVATLRDAYVNAIARRRNRDA